MKECHLGAKPIRGLTARILVLGMVIAAFTTVSVAVRPAAASSEGERIVSIAQGQIGVAANPYGTNCNPYSAYWGDGTSCGNGNRSAAWCADFVAWAWAQAGVTGLYGHGISALAASFQTWGTATGHWHPLGSGYTPQPGDAVEYSGKHVAIYVSGPASSPTVVNGNWWYPKTGTGQVYQQKNETSNGAGAALSGYVSPPNLASPPATPSPPSASGSSDGSGKATISWSAPANNGANIDAYHVQDDAGRTWTTSSTSLTVSGLALHTWYFFTVQAHNAVGWGPWSNWSNAVYIDAPYVPPSLVLTDSHIVTSGVNGSALHVDYTLNYNRGSEPNPPAQQLWPMVFFGATYPVFCAGIDGDGFPNSGGVSLHGGESYTCNVDALVTGAIGAPGTTVQVSAFMLGQDAADTVSHSVLGLITLSSVPDAPSAVSAAARNQSALVTWSAPANNGSAISTYTVTASSGASVMVPVTQTSATVNGLSNGKAYTFTVTATNGVGTGAASVASNAVTPADLPTISVGDQGVLEGDTGGRAVKFAVTLSRPSTKTVSVHYSITGASATGGSTPGTGIDLKIASGTLTFLVSPTTGKTAVVAYVPVVIYGDTTSEQNETFNVTLSAPTAAYRARDKGTGTILDDDTSAQGVKVGVGNGATVRAGIGTAYLTIPVSLSAPLSHAVSVSYTITPGSATHSNAASGGGDYGGPTTGTLSFSSGVTLLNIPIPIWAHGLDADKAFSVRLSSPTDAGLSLRKAVGTATILSAFTPIGDLDVDGLVNCADLAVLRAQWAQTAPGLAADLNGDGVVDIFDLAIMATNWSGSTQSGGC